MYEPIPGHYRALEGVMDTRSAANGSANRRVLLIGPGELPDATHRALTAATAQVIRLPHPNDAEIREVLGDQVDSVIVCSRDDAVALRLALVVEHVRPGIPLIVTVHSRVVAAQLERAVSNIRVTSMAEIVAPSLAAPCLDDRLLWVRPTPEGLSGVRADHARPRLVEIKPADRRRGQQLLASLGSLVRPFEPSARILTAGLFGFLLLLVLDIVATILIFGQSPIDAFYAATRTIVTVGPDQAVDRGPGWAKVFSALSMLSAVAFTALCTAGVVERLLDRRLTTVIGPRAVPRNGHVVVVGLGQVGLRLCRLLRELGVPVLAIESDPDRYNVARAKNYRLPVVIGRARSHFVLQRLSLHRARALAAVTSHEIENISVAVAALSMHDTLRTILRAGRGEVVNETRSLFRIGVVRDVYRIGGTLLAAAALGSNATDAFLHEQTVYLIMPDGSIEPFEADVAAASTLVPAAGWKSSSKFAPKYLNSTVSLVRPMVYGRASEALDGDVQFAACDTINLFDRLRTYHLT
ncbi:MAG TPA: NAD-binding protein [Pseudonocardiaceae bacterium]